MRTRVTAVSLWPLAKRFRRRRRGMGSHVVCTLALFGATQHAEHRNALHQTIKRSADQGDCPAGFFLPAFPFFFALSAAAAGLAFALAGLVGLVLVPAALAGLAWPSARLGCLAEAAGAASGLPAGAGAAGATAGTTVAAFLAFFD